MTAAGEPGRGALVGLWRLTSAEHWASGARVYPFGAAPLGSMLIAADGAISCQVARNEPREAISAGGSTAPIHERLFAVWGRWSLAGELLLIDVLGSADPALVGVVQRRRYTLEGERLILESVGASSGASRSGYAIRWARVP